jgi:diguanylate cyclase (GGDEF)-like protein
VHEKWTPNTILTSATFAGTDSLRVNEPKIQHKSATFEAKFAAPSFENTADQRCRYQLQGLEKEPVETRLREVRYTALPGGSYTFTVSCGSVATGWGLPANYSFVVMPPWWLRWWAVALAVLLATLTLRWVIYLRTRALERDRTLLEEAVEERSAELAAANRRLEELSLTDPLTGVQNRRFFDLVVPRQTQQALRAFQAAGPERPPLDRDVVLFFVDLDHFKKVNDTYGHAAGDRALVEVVARLNSVVRQVDSLVRWGGEEFVIVSEGNSRETAHQMAQRILQAVASEPIDLGDGKQQRLTCSVGWAPYPWFVSWPEKVGIDQVINSADRGLYLAKSEGRNRAVGVLPASEDRNAAPLQNENQEVRFVRDVGPTGDCAPVAVTQESHIR